MSAPIELHTSPSLAAFKATEGSPTRFLKQGDDAGTFVLAKRMKNTKLQQKYGFNVVNEVVVDTNDQSFDDFDDETEELVYVVSAEIMREFITDSHDALCRPEYYVIALGTVRATMDCMERLSTRDIPGRLRQLAPLVVPDQFKQYDQSQCAGFHGM